VLATEFGHHAVELLIAGQSNRMVALQRGRLTSVPIAEVADRQKLVPHDDPLVEACRSIGTSFGDR
jgi:6-phosphofructokinase 1